MTIKTKLLVNIFLPVGTLLVIILVMISFQRYKDETERMNDTALVLLADMMELSQRTDAYLLLGDKQARTEWHRIDASVSALMDQLHFEDNDLSLTLERIQHNLREMRDLFAEAAHERGSPALQDQVGADRERQGGLSRQIVMRADNVSSDALRLYRMSRIARNRHAVRLHAFVLAFFLVSLAISVSTLVPINRSIGASVAKLISGAEIVGSGNLEHEIGLRTKDELGRLSSAFDAMTGSLRTTTVSRDALAREVAHRKEAEEELRKARDELEIRVHERTEELRNAYERLVKESGERKQAEEQLRRAQKMDALGTLTGGIAHDFNNILAAIIGFTELTVSRMNQESRDAQNLQRVFQAALRGRELIRQLLTFSRQEKQEKKPLKLSSITKETMKLMRASIPTSIDIRVKVESGSDMILGDPVQVQQVLMNLCTNASHAMREKGGVLDVELSNFDASVASDGMKPGHYVKLLVQDTGCGIPEGIIDKIFDPFFTTKGPDGGTGLGLSVVHGIVREHEGHIRVESEQGKGSAFSVYFPKATIKSSTIAAREGAAPTGCERILLVDDEETLALMEQDMLSDLGYGVIKKTNSREALALFRLDPSRFDLVITDQTMPELTGIELAREILDLRPDMPVILCTGFSHAVDADSAKTAGIKAFVMKPMTKGEIARTIRSVLDG